MDEKGLATCQEACRLLEMMRDQVRRQEDLKKDEYINISNGSTRHFAGDPRLDDPEGMDLRCFEGVGCVACL